MTTESDFHADQRKTARWMGYGDDVEAMNRHHDRLHAKVCSMFGVESRSLRAAAGETLTGADWHIGNYEEDAVLNLQRWLVKAGVDIDKLLED